MTAVVFDGASPFDLAAARRAGAVAISGYIVGNPGGFWPVTKTRVAQIRSMGMGFVPNWERGAAYLVSCGKSGGAQAGLEAVVACRALGVPDDGTVAVPFSWDTYIDPSLYPQCGVVADGIINGLGGHYLFSAYGQGGLIDYFVKTGRLKPGVKAWLSMSEGFPGFDINSGHVAMVQEHHADGSWFSSPVAGTDVNTLIDPTGLHAWWPDDSPYGDAMSFTIDDVRAAVREELQYALAFISKGGENTRFNSTPAGGNLPATGGVKVTAGVPDNSAALAALSAVVDTLASKLSTSGAVAPTAFTGTVNLTAK